MSASNVERIQDVVTVCHSPVIVAIILLFVLKFDGAIPLSITTSPESMETLFVNGIRFPPFLEKNHSDTEKAHGHPDVCSVTELEETDCERFSGDDLVNNHTILPDPRVLTDQPVV